MEKKSYVPVRNVHEYTSEDFSLVSHYFKNAPFTYKFMGVDVGGFRQRAKALNCFYPQYFVVKDNGVTKRVPNPDFQEATIDLPYMENPRGLGNSSYITDVNEVDALIVRLNQENSTAIIPSGPEMDSPAPSAKEIETIFTSLFNSVFTQKMNEMDSKINMILDTINFQKAIGTKDFETFKEFIKGDSEGFTEFVKFKNGVSLPVHEKIVEKIVEKPVGVSLRELDERAKKLDYPSREYVLNLMRNYDSYEQVAKATGKSAYIIKKWATFHGLESVYALKVQNRL